MDHSATSVEPIKKQPYCRRPFFVTAFVHEIQEWAEHSTFHGIPAVFSPKTSLIRKFFWLCVIGASIVALQYGYKVQINRFLEYRTIGKETIRAEDTLVFPAITICSMCLVQNDSSADDREIQLLKDMYSNDVNGSYLNETYGWDFLSSFKMSEMLRKHVVPADEIFYRCGWGGPTMNCSEYIQSQMFTDDSCYTINGASNNSTLLSSAVGSDNGLYLVLFTNQDNYFLSSGIASAGFKVLVHDQNQDIDMALSTYLSPGFSYYIGISKVEHKLMPPPVKAFGAKECQDIKAHTVKNHHGHFPKHSFSACRTDCLTHYVYNACACVIPFHEGFYRECDPIETVLCVFPAYVHFHRNSAAIVDDCGCMMPCEYTEYNMKVSSAYFPNNNYVKQNKDILKGKLQDIDYIRANYLAVSIYFDSKIVKTYEQILEFPGSDLMASLSGYLGLAIGASVLTFVEFLEIFFIVLGRMFNRR